MSKLSAARGWPSKLQVIIKKGKVYWDFISNILCFNPLRMYEVNCGKTSLMSEMLK